MIIKLNKTVTPVEIKNRSCYFDNQIENLAMFVDKQGNDIEYIATLRPMKNNCYQFSVDMCSKSYMRTLNANEPEDKLLMIQALEYDYGFDKDEYEIMS